MKRGPDPTRHVARNGDDRSFAQKATEAWGSVPEWVVALADLADRKRLRGAAADVGYSAGAISNVINNKAGALDIGRLEEKVRGALMGLTVSCPRLEEISRKVCLDWQQKPFAPTSSLRTQMYRACRGGCPHFRIRGGSDE